MKRKSIVNNRNELANLATKLEDSKIEATVGAVRKLLKKMKQLDMACTLRGWKSPLVMLRREVLRDYKLMTKSQRKRIAATLTGNF